MRKLASIQKIISLEPIKDADFIEKANVLGWELIVKKGEFKVGDLCVYIEIDSIVPDVPAFQFLKNKNFRIKTIKMKGTYSQGIALPLSIIKEVSGFNPDYLNLKEEEEVTDVLKIKKYDPELEEEMRTEISQKKKTKFQFYLWKIKKFFGFEKKKKDGNSFPSYLVPKTDETRISSIPGSLAKHSGKMAYIMEKLDGSSTSFIFFKTKGFLSNPHIFYVCSRNLIKNMYDTNDKFVKYAIENDIENKLKKYGKDIAIQGELTGPGIQKNPYKEEKHNFRVFRIYDLKRKEYYKFDEFILACADMGLTTVPILEESHIIHTDVKRYVSDASGKSKINPSVEREGIVVRLKDENYSFKSVSRDFLLKTEQD